MKRVCILAVIVGGLFTTGISNSDAAGPNSYVPAGTSEQRANDPALSPAAFADSFVQRTGSTLTLGGSPFRFAGANVEFLGLENYGPNPSTELPAGSERYPSHYEVDDALATAHEMGATVLRVQTLGDTVGCALCLEPSQGVFNPAAFAQTDFLVAEARRYGLKLFGELDGDANSSPAPGVTALQQQSHGWYCSWHSNTTDCGLSFFSGAAEIADYEAHMAAVLNHVNPLTGLAYKDDPTIAGWVDGNNLNLLDAVPPPTVESWIGTVSSYFKTIDTKQLYADISLTGGDEEVTPTVLAIPGVDIYGQEYYPHWFPVAQGGDRVDGTAPLLHTIAAQVAAAGKAYATLEYGWDNTNFLTPTALQQFLTAIQADPNVVGVNLWALVSHQDGHGWQPIPADTGCSPTCETLEDGNWWALYYTGLDTASNQAADMAARAQLMRSADYTLDGFAATPAHELVAPATVTTLTGGRVYWQGSAGSPTYSIDVQRPGTTIWVRSCSGCAKDSDNGWLDPTPVAGSCYRVTAANLDGIAAAPSTPMCMAAAAALTTTRTTTAKPGTTVKQPAVRSKRMTRVAKSAVGQPRGTLAYTGLGAAVPACALLLCLAGFVVRRRVLS